VKQNVKTVAHIVKQKTSNLNNNTKHMNCNVKNTENTLTTWDTT